MNTLKNRVTLMGNLGKAPEMITLESGRKLAKMSLATDETYKNKQGEKVKETQWHSLTAWGKTAELLEKYATKGTELAVGGKLITRSYDSKEGEKRYRTEVEVSEILFLDKKSNN
jgi:single-strand DNA-binding protein